MVELLYMALTVLVAVLCYAAILALIGWWSNRNTHVPNQKESFDVYYSILGVIARNKKGEDHDV